MALRFVTWNCRVGGFAKKKAKYVASLQPDVLAVQELETLKVLPSFCGDRQPTYHDRQAHPEFPRRAIGMFSYSGLPIQAADGVKTLYSFRRYEVRRGDLAFNVAAVWPWATKSKKTSYRQAHEGLEQHADWIKERPTVILGDFNAHQSFNGPNWNDLVELLRPFGFVSAYHRHFNKAFGQESHSTYFHRGKPESGFHLDYCFIPEPWADRIADVQIDPYEKWRHVSDHVPLVVDLAL